MERTRSVSHGVFSIERAYDAPIERVWRALSDREAKAKWFGGTVGEWSEIERAMDFRVGGAERLEGRWANGVVSAFDAVYHDIVPDQRIVYSYTMHLERGEDLRLARDDGAQRREFWPHAPESDGTGRFPRRLRRRRLARARHGVPARQARRVARERSLSDQRAGPDRTIVPSPDIALQRRPVSDGPCGVGLAATPRVASSKARPSCRPSEIRAAPIR